ncbi:isoaspartyl peptidase/L-asparaginase family protein [Catalinimonas niigatensis]|uniref:isoaspartyl peptidase/L-asparaginase family protein n=1 Tax=Catalinimonas niigatensis TaxID=1397264 RepID=UPI002AA2A171|nr:isoaspartyl peptidase/L-asparaginase [Catalinimonas niigatensis]WPP50945.1 isoaspartyl peptidase/L-asparaginase [Catalinimonas niigatensis]
MPANNQFDMPIAIALHGGAGTILRSEMSPEKEVQYTHALKDALHAAYQHLLDHGSALDAVEIAVTMLEDCPLFNAGKGSVFTAEGKHEMDASIMEGRNRSAGAISLVTGVKNPIRLARLVMEKSEHVFLAGSGAMEFARKMKCDFADETYFFDRFRYDQWQKIKDTQSFQLDHSVNTDQEKPKKMGTVGAVACDVQGNIAAATSTGGMTNKRWGRIGDSPVIGSGTYAHNLTCAVSCTGSGEYFLRGVVAYDVSCLIEYKNYSLAQACQEVILQRLLELGGDGGLVAVNAKGEVSMTFNTEGMYRASKSPLGETIAIYDA